ncbi:MAG: HEAT repeat domain-containing protein [Anaerolineae bacterium]|nr:HEAT repeat domain-containing protein [Anaerolineae bacterium]
MTDYQQIQALIDKLHPQAWDTVQALVDIGQPAVEPLLKALHNPNGHIRLGAARVLGRIRDIRAVEPLIGTLKDVDQEVAGAAAQALGQLGDKRAVEPLIAVIPHSSIFLACPAILALGEMGDARAIEPLIAASLDGALMREAALALGRFNDIRTIKALINLLRQEDDDKAWNYAFDGLKAIGIPAVQSLIDALHDDDEGVRGAAAGLLGEIGDRSAIASLVVVLEDSNEWVRRAAKDALAQLGYEPKQLQ